MKNGVTPIEKMGLKNLERIYNISIEIQSELELSTNSKVFLKLHPYQKNHEDIIKGINYLIGSGVIKSISKSKIEEGTTLEVRLDIRTEKITKVIKQINKRMAEIAKEMIYKGKDSLAKSMTMSYNANTRVFFIRENSFILSEDRNQAELCNVILNKKFNVNKTWSWDEILEEWGWEEHRITEKPTRPKQLMVHNAAKLFNMRIDKETNHLIDDFFISNMKTVRVNPKYLPKS